MSSPLVIDYYTDVLCVWAWIVQRRIDELQSKWGDQIELRRHFVNVFGDTSARIGEQWKDRGGYEGFGRHVAESAEPYETAPVNAEVWTKVRPSTSANAHMVVKAVSIGAGRDAAAELELAIRHAFFVNAMDIGDIDVLIEVAAEAKLDKDMLRQALRDGSAVAALTRDFQSANANGVSGSPSWLMNEGRQKLYGNVGFGVLDANVEGLLARHAGEASWC